MQIRVGMVMSVGHSFGLKENDDIIY